MKQIIYIVTLLVWASMAKAQELKLEWVKSFGAAFDDVGGSIKKDKFGNIYTLGSFQGTVDFDPGPDSFYLTSIGDRHNTVIIKLNSKGDFLWAKSFGGTGFCLDIDSKGNIYTTGGFDGTVDFDPDAGVYNLASKGRYDIFITKLDNHGKFSWAKKFGGNSIDEGVAITVDKFGNVYVTGGFHDTADFDPGLDTFNLIAETSPTLKFKQDIFILKLNANGGFIWAKRIGGDGSGGGRAIALDREGNLFITGVFEGIGIDFDPGEESLILNSNGGFDIFILKLDSKGDFLWAEQIGGPGSDFGNSIAIDREGNTCITGFFSKTVDFNPKEGIFNLEANQSLSIGWYYDIFILKLNPEGDLLWAKKLGENLSDEGKAITVDLFGNVYAIGSYCDSLKLDSTSSSYKNFTNEDIFLSKFDANGELIWMKLFIGNSNDVGTSIIVNSKGDIFTTGYFFENTNFNPDASLDYYLHSKGSTDIFIHKLSQPNFKKKFK